MDTTPTTSHSKTTRRGRPRGRKTDPPQRITRDLPRCPHCASTQLRVLATTRRSIAGTLASGARYTQVVWQRCRCGHCGQQSMARSYPFDPAEWRE